MDLQAITPGMYKDELQHRRDLCVAGAWLYRRGFVVATDGSVTALLEDPQQRRLTR